MDWSNIKPPINTNLPKNGNTKNKLTCLMILADQCLHSNRRFHAGNFERFIILLYAFVIRNNLGTSCKRFSNEFLAFVIAKEIRLSSSSKEQLSKTQGFFCNVYFSLRKS